MPTREELEAQMTAARAKLTEARRMHRDQEVIDRLTAAIAAIQAQLDALP